MKEKFKQVLLQLILEKSFGAISIDNIVDAAKVGKGSFYRYFKDKQSLLIYAFQDFHREYLQYAKQQRGENGEDPQSLSESIGVFLNFCLQKREFSRLMISVRNEIDLDIYQWKYRRLFQKGIMQDLQKNKNLTGLDLPSLAILVMAMMYEIAFLEGQQNQALTDMRKTLFDLIANLPAKKT